MPRLLHLSGEQDPRRKAKTSSRSRMLLLDAEATPESNLGGLMPPAGADHPDEPARPHHHTRFQRGSFPDSPAPGGTTDESDRFWQISGADAETSYRRPVRERAGAGRMSTCVRVCPPPPRRKTA